VADGLAPLLQAKAHDSWGLSLRLGFERSDEGHAITLAHGLIL
jgi:hypothetical protein